MPSSHAGDRGHDLSRRAIPTLKRIIVYEGLLHWVKVRAFSEALDRGDLPSIDLGRQRETGRDRPAIQMNRASPTLSVIAALLGPGQLSPLTQQIEERSAGIDLKNHRSAVHVRRDLNRLAGFGTRELLLCLGSLLEWQDARSGSPSSASEHNATRDAAGLCSLGPFVFHYRASLFALPSWSRDCACELCAEGRTIVRVRRRIDRAYEP